MKGLHHYKFRLSHRTHLPRNSENDLSPLRFNEEEIFDGLTKKNSLYQTRNVSTGIVWSILFFTLFLHQSQLFSQCFKPSVQIGSGSNRKSIVTGDYNGDGNQDFVTANNGSNSVSLFRGNGLGTFSAPVQYTVGTTPLFVANGDFNRDGKLDIVAVNNGSNTISILINNGVGGFGAATNYPTATGPYGVSVGDFNNDSYSDVATADYSNNSFSIRLGNGAGVFGSISTVPIVVSGLSQPSAILSGDFNKDGNADVALTMYTGNKVLVYLGNGTGSFSSPINAGYSVGARPVSLIAVDLNNDSALDLAVANNNSPYNISVLLGTSGNPYFGTALNYPAGTSPTSIVSGDFDSDGIIDLASSNSGSAFISIFSGNGFGLFSTQTAYPANAGAQPQSIAAADFDRDGNLDIVSANNAVSNANKGVSVFINDPAPTTPVVSITQPTCSQSTGTINVGIQKVGSTYSFDNGLSFQTNNSLTGASSGTYQIIIKNSSGCLSPVISVQVSLPPVIPSTPVATVTAVDCAISLQITPQNVGDVYSIDGGVNFSSTNLFTQIPPKNYQLVIKNADGCTASANITVDPLPGAPAAPTVDVIQPTCSNLFGQATIVVENPTDLYSFDNGLSFQVSNNNSTLSPSSDAYKLVVKNADGCTSSDTPITILNAKPAFKIVAGDGSEISGTTQNICDFADSGFSLVPTNNAQNVKFFWTILSSTNVLGASSLDPLAAIDAANLTPYLSLSSLDRQNAGTVSYQFQAVSNGCVGDQSSIVTLNVNPIPLINISNNGNNISNNDQVVICSGNNFQLQFDNQVPDTEFSWTTVATNVTGSSDGKGNSLSQFLYSTTGNTQGNVTYTFTPYTPNCIGNPAKVDVTVKPIPTLQTNGATQSVCDGGQVNIVLSNPNSVSGVGYLWSPDSHGVNGALSQDTPSANPITDALLLVTPNSAGFVNYSIQAVADGCTSPTQTVAVTVNPVPDIQITNQSPKVCNGDQVTILLASPSKNLANVTYQWAWKNPSANLATPLETNGITFNRITQTVNLLNNTSGVGSVTYQITPSTIFCSGTAAESTVTVNPNPKITIAPSFTLCSGSSATILDQNSGQNYSWDILTTDNVSNIGTARTGVKLIETLTAVDGTNPGTVIYKISSVSSENCASAPAYTVANVYPKPSFTLQNSSALVNGLNTICSGERTAITFIGDVPGSELLLKSIVYNGIGGGAVEAGKSRFVDGQLLNQLLTNDYSDERTVFYEFEPVYGTCAGEKISTSVAVSPTPKMTLSTASTTICSGSFADIAFSSDNGSIAKLESVDYNGTSEGGTALNSSFANGGHLTEKLINNSNVQVLVTYAFRIYSSICSSYTLNYVRITVLPNPIFSIQNLKENICSGNPVSIQLKTNVEGALIRIDAIDYGNVSGSGSYVPYSTNQNSFTIFTNNAILNETLTNQASTASNVTYSFQSTIANCAPSAVQKAIVSVDLSPKFSIVNATGSNNSAILCKEGNANISVLTQTANTTIRLLPVDYKGTQGTYSNGFLFPVGDVKINELLKSDGLVQQKITYSFVASSPGCTDAGLQQTSITTKPLPLVSFQGLSQQLSQSSDSIILTGNQKGGFFTSSPAPQSIAQSSKSLTDQATFYPAKSVVGTNNVTYNYTDQDNCSNFYSQNVNINPTAVISFSIEKSPPNASGFIEICANSGRLKLTGSPALSSGQAPETKFSSDADILQFDGTDYYLKTDGTASGVYNVSYTYKDGFNGVTSKNSIVKILASPNAAIIARNSCITSPVTFVDGSTLDSQETSINSWKWSFGDGNSTSTEQNPSYTYPAANYGDKVISLTVSTRQGCTSTVSKTITVGPSPEVDFFWNSVCNSDNTTFQDNTKLPLGSIVSYSWDFGEGGAPTTGTSSPSHVFKGPGTFKTQLTVTTNNGCEVKAQKNVFILPFVDVTSTKSYNQNFESSSGGWVSEAFEAKNSPTKDPKDTKFKYIASDTSWLWTVPSGASINNSLSTKAWWTGAHYSTAKTYWPNENSAVNSPCFNLSSLQRPMISLDYFVDTQSGVDGSVLQYSVDGGSTWQAVGVYDPFNPKGISWYNQSAITSNPGSQLVGQYGWGDNSTKKWINGRFNLDAIPKNLRNKVRFRIAFSSDGSNPQQSGKTYDGFAFDNVFVGDKKRNVLIEHFTNYQSNASRNGDIYLNQLFDNQSGATNFNAIQYHIDWPNADTLNQASQPDVAARALFFGVSQSPFTIMDGALGSAFKIGNTTFDGDYNKITSDLVDTRSLVDPQFDVAITNARQGSTPRKVSFDLTITSNANVTTPPLLLYATLVEKNIANFRNVVRKQLLGSDGKTLNATSWIKDDPKIYTITDVDIDVPIADPKKLSIIAFLQDKNTKEIFESTVIDAPELKGRLITGIADTQPESKISEITIFPNPATKGFKIALPPTLVGNFEWKIIDQRGIEVKTGNFETVLKQVMEVDVSELASGIYSVVFAAQNQPIEYRKLVILNR